MDRLVGGALVIFIAIVLFHLAVHDRLQNIGRAWTRLKGEQVHG